MGHARGIPPRAILRRRRSHGEARGHQQVFERSPIRRHMAWRYDEGPRRSRDCKRDTSRICGRSVCCTAQQNNQENHILIPNSGQAFPEDAPVSGTYENGHISNFRVPLVFRHPLLPALQVTANATSMSVVPTILDLLVNSGSLNEMDSSAALDLMNEYEGQSLVRPYQATHNGRQAWNFGIINPGGTMLSLGSAAVPYRLILPLAEDFEYIFSDLDTDPDELSPLRGWSLEELIGRVQRKHGDKAGKWLVDAEKVGKWWIKEQKILWNRQ